MRCWLSFALCCAVAASTGTSLADNLADEADLLFRRGALAYQRGDYEAALERFLASNRLVPNQNVVFNIAYTYERLGRYPEAYRYFMDARENERDADQLRRIDAALDVIVRHVAVLRVESEPAGATLFLERKDLGSQGSTPRAFGLTPGAHLLLIELSGYYPQRIELEPLQAAEKRSLRVTLRPIVGSVRVEGEAGMLVKKSPEPSEPGGGVPCTLELLPGERRLWLSRPGFRSAELPVAVVPERTLTVRPRLEPIQGSLVITTDEPAAQVEIDGRTSGFTPTVVSLPIGSHQIRIKHKGYRVVERTVVVSSDAEQALNVVLTQDEQVTAVSRASERVTEAPSSVSVLSREEIQAFRYPTLAEALRGVPGLYVSDDRSYVTLGIRGVSRLGSYGNRVLVLSDGLPLNDNWLGSSYVGYDGRADLGDIERLEVVRGPGSVVYGTSAFSGVINVVTRPAASAPRATLGVGAEGDGVGRARARAEAPLGEHGSIWASAAGARGSGRDYFFPDLVQAEPNSAGGYARAVDSFNVATLEGKVTHRFLSAQWFWSSHDKILPTGVSRTLVGDSRARQRDTRAALELRAEPRLLPTLSWLSRVHANLYRFHGAYPRSERDGGLEVDTFRGAWLGLEQRLELKPLSTLRLFVGGEVQSHFQVEQQAVNEAGVLLDDTGDRGHPFWVGAGYATVDARPSPNVALYAGARLDAYSTFGSALNPRLGAVFRPYARGNLKILAGKAFRAPSVYELYYNDGGFTQSESPDLGPEHIYSTELEFTHELDPRLFASATLFGNYLSDLVVSRGAGTTQDPLRYVNSNVPLVTVGGELGLRRDLRQGAMFAASYGLLVARYLSDRGLAALFEFRQNPEFRRVANVPTHLLTLKGMLPVLGNSLRLASRVTLESGRFDRFERVSDPRQLATPAVALWDVVLTGVAVPVRGSRPSVDWALGVYNAFDYRYSLPVSAEFAQRTVSQSGRSLLLSAELGL
jgi:outer membrane receptor protein involved in Fe transport